MSQQGMAVELPLVHRRSFSARSILVEHSPKEIIAIEFLVTIAAYYLGILLSPHYDILVGGRELVFIGILHALITVVTNIGLGSYEFTKRFRFSTIGINSCVSQLSAFFFSIAITYLGFYSAFGRLSVAYGVASSLVGVVVLKLLMRQHVLMNPYILSTLGSSALLVKIQERCQREHLGFRCLPIEVDLYNIERLLTAIQANHSKTIILSSAFARHENFVDFSLAAAEMGITVADELEFYTYLFEHIPIDFIDKRWLFHMGVLRPSALFMASKRIFDLLFSCSCLVIFLPLIILISLFIKLSSRGPVLFVQPRIGRYSKLFYVYKFRTMHQYSGSSSTQPLVTSKNDERLTLVGKIIRPLHLDELPQLVNIIKGEMSFVGVRPETIAYGQQMQGEMPVYHLRDLFNPGITGHAQLSMHYPMHTIEDTKKKLGYDFYYLMNQGIVLDIRIICKTFFKLIFP